MMNNHVVIVMMLCILLVTLVNSQHQEQQRLRNAYDQQRFIVTSEAMTGDTTGKQEDLVENLLLKEDFALWDHMLFDGSMSASLSLSMGGGFDSCVDPSIAEFEIDEDVNIGDTFYHPGPGFTRRCGQDCYTVEDSGDDPDFDPERGDTLRFAYRSVTSTQFRIRSRVCGVDCLFGESDEGFCGRTGLMVRESLDPFSKNIFAAHEPDSQAFWWYRLDNGDYGDEPVFGSDGSPDVECLWITLERNGNQFTFSYDYEGESDCELCQCLELTQTVSIEMPKRVLVGLGVSSPALEGYRIFTTANFRDIEFLYE